jgi:serine/threonine protein kinase/tetratricopeptide (TPR) repeat protein
VRRKEPTTQPSASGPIASGAAGSGVGSGAGSGRGSGPSRRGSRDFSGTERFELIRQLGMGGMGVVYEALDHDSHEKVALKTLRNFDGTAILMFKQEFRSVSGVHHPNLVRLGELFESRGDWFFTMELVDGVDLTTWLREGDTQRIRETLAQLVTGLGALHDAGHVHRDVKPTNVLVSNGRAILLDFGLAIRHDRDPLSWSDSEMVGTPAYMAPEQASAGVAGPEADFYSVGVILYEALTGKLPIEGHALEMMMKKQRIVPAAPSTLISNVPADLDALCVELLAIDPAVRPQRADIMKRLGSTGRTSRPDLPKVPRDVAVSMTPLPRQTFVGRETELGVLKSALAECDTGVPVNLLIEAESGMGKSALAEQFIAGLDRRDVVVLRGRCYERESVPYKGIDGVIDSISRFLARLPDKTAAGLLPFHIALLAEVFPVLRGVRVIVEQPPVTHVPDPHEERRRVFAAVREMLARIGARYPLVILIDDLHWADEDSLALLDAVLRPPDAPCVLLISTAWPRGDDESKIQFGGMRRMKLAPLGEKDTTELARALFNAMRSPVADAMANTIVRESAGHPMFVAELVRHSVLHKGSGVPAEDVRLEEVLAERITALEPAERELLELVSAAGQPLPLDVIARALGVTPSKLIPLLGYLQSATLLRATGRTRRDSVEPYHDSTRRAVVSRLAERKPDVHRRLAVALEATDADTQPMLVGGHWEQAGEPARAAALYARAGDRATEAFAFERAVRLYEKCLALAPEMGTALRPKLGDAYANAGRGREAAEVYLALAKESKVAADALELEQKAAHQLLRGGHIDDGMNVLEKLLASVDIPLPKTPKRALASLLWRRARVRMRGAQFKPKDPSQLAREELAKIDIVWAAACGLSMTDWIHGASFQALNLLLSLNAGETVRAKRALLLEACHVAASGGSSVRAEKLVEAATGGKELDDPYLRGWVELARAYIAYFGGRWRAAFEGAEQADALFSSNCKDVVWERDTVHALSHWAQVQLGSLKTLGQMLPARLHEAQSQGNLYAVWALPATISIVHWLARDDVKGGRAAVDMTSEKWSLRGYQIQHWNAMASNALLDIYAGDVRTAHKRLEDGWGPMSKSLLTKIQIIRFEVTELRARAALAAARVSTGSEKERLLVLAEQQTEKIGKEGLPWTNAITSLRRAGILDARGDKDAAIREYRAAVEASDAANLGGHAAAARVRLGTLLGDDEGAAIREKGIESLRAEDVEKPEQFVALYAP